MNLSIEPETFADEERRAAPRFVADLKEPVLITATVKMPDETEECLFLHGRTHDISTSGLALIISNDDWRELERFQPGYLMGLMLPLPGKPIEIEVRPVRFQPLASSETGEILIGATIVRMSEYSRKLFMEFIDTRPFMTVSVVNSYNFGA